MPNYSAPIAKNLSGHFREKLKVPSCLESEAVYGKVVPDLLNSLNSRSHRGEVTFGRFFHFLHTKSEIPSKSKFQLNPALGLRDSKLR